MELLVVAAVFVVVVAVVVVLGRRHRRRGWGVGLPESRRDRERLDGPDARGAVNRSSWMLGGGGGGGGG